MVCDGEPALVWSQNIGDRCRTLERDRSGVRRVRACAGESPIQAGVDHTRSHSRVVPGSQLGEELYRLDHLDAYVLACQDVDLGSYSSEETLPASAYTIQPGDPVVQHRHGFHEPQPGCAW